MSVRSGQSVTVLFTTRVLATGVGTNADSLPTGTLYVNGTSNAATVTVTNISTGLYKSAVTLPTLAVGDEVEMVIAATVSGVTDSAVIWGDTKDLVIDSAGLTDANMVKAGPSGSGTPQTAADIGLQSTNSANSASSALGYSTRAVIRGTVGSGSTTTSVVTSALDIAGSNANQLNGRVLIFDKTTATAQLQGQGGVISAITVSATPTITIPALTTAPSSGDVFTIY